VRKLLQLKRWLTLPDAAQYLSDSLGEDVYKSDVLRLALDGELVLSVHFVNHAKALCGRTVPLADAKRHVMPSLDGKGVFTFIEGTAIPGERVIEFEEQVRTLTGVWDLTMWGAEALDVENMYQTLTFGPAVELLSLEGAFVTDGNGQYCKVMARFTEDELGGTPKLKSPYDHPSNYFPAGTLPEDSVFVVRVSSLKALEARMAAEEQPLAKQSERAPEKAIERRERSTLLTVIAALARMAKVDVARPSSAAAAIENETELMGARVAARTIENHLKAIPEVVDSRTQ
jgi:hypothetical protein